MLPPKEPVVHVSSRRPTEPPFVAACPSNDERPHTLIPHPRRNGSHANGLSSTPSKLGMSVAHRTRPPNDGTDGTGASTDRHPRAPATRQLRTRGLARGRCNYRTVKAAPWCGLVVSSWHSALPIGLLWSWTKTGEDLAGSCRARGVHRRDSVRTCDQNGGQRITDRPSVGVRRQSPGVDIYSTDQSLWMVSQDPADLRIIGGEVEPRSYLDRQPRPSHVDHLTA